MLAEFQKLVRFVLKDNAKNAVISNECVKFIKKTLLTFRTEERRRVS